jgi:hypothetical protein
MEHDLQGLEPLIMKFLGEEAENPYETEYCPKNDHADTSQEQRSRQLM